MWSGSLGSSIVSTRRIRPGTTVWIWLALLTDCLQWWVATQRSILTSLRGLRFCCLCSHRSLSSDVLIAPIPPPQKMLAESNEENEQRKEAGFIDTSQRLNRYNFRNQYIGGKKTMRKYQVRRIALMRTLSGLGRPSAFGSCRH